MTNVPSGPFFACIILKPRDLVKNEAERDLETFLESGFVRIPVLLLGKIRDYLPQGAIRQFFQNRQTETAQTENEERYDLT